MLTSTGMVNAKADDKVTLKVALWDYSNVSYFKDIFSKFNEVYPDIEIEPLEFPSDEYNTTVMTQLGGRADFDVIFIKDSPNLSALSQQGHLLALDDYIAEDEEFDASAYKGLVEAQSLDGSVYGLPFRYDNTVLFYNKDLFDAAGVDYPTDGMTLAEYHELAAKLTSGEGNDKVYGAHNHTWTTNVTQFARITDAYNPNDASTFDAVKDCYNEILAMQDEGVIMDYGAVKSANLHYSGVFYNQQAAMLPIGTWYINMLCENVSDFNWGVCSLPNNGGLKNENSVGSAVPVTIGAYGKNPDAAWTLIKYVCSSDAAEVLASNGIVPGIASDEVKAIFDAIPEKYPNAPEGLSKYISGEEKALLENPMDPQSKDIENIMNEAHSAIMTESVSVDDALQDAVKRIGDLF